GQGSAQPRVVNSARAGRYSPPPAGPAYRNFQERFQAAYQAELAAFLDVALGRRANPCTAQDAYQALRVAVACDLSRAERRPVSLEEVA
ncbi:MAG: Gfo/Idh/MocA family oxidoreductase, partial [Acidimicrobiia bacterium]